MAQLPSSALLLGYRQGRVHQGRLRPQAEQHPDQSSFVTVRAMPGAVHGPIIAVPAVPIPVRDSAVSAELFLIKSLRFSFITN